MEHWLNLFDSPEINTDYSYVRNHYYSSFSPGNLDDVIKISVTSSESCTLPSRSSLIIHGTIKKDSSTTQTEAVVSLINNGLLFLFDSFAYNLNNETVEVVRNPGIVSTYKIYTLFNSDQVRALCSAGISHPVDTVSKAIFVDAEKTKFQAVVPLSLVFGIFASYDKALLNITQELNLVRANSAKNALISDRPANCSSIELTKIQWCLPHLGLNDVSKSKVLNTIAKDPPIRMHYRYWEVIEHPLIPSSTDVIWRVKTEKGSTAPKMAILAFYVNKKNDITKDLTKPDAVGLTSVKMYLNDLVFPFNEISQDVLQYKSYLEMGQFYFNENFPSPLLSFEAWEKNPFYVINSMIQKDYPDSQPVDIRIEMKFSTPPNHNTNCYLILVSERVCAYTPHTQTVST